VSELLLGCGFSRKKLLGLPGQPLEWRDLVTLDINEKCDPDMVCNIDVCHQWNVARSNENAARFLSFVLIDEPHSLAPPWTMTEIRDNSFEEVHAYEVLEHLGSQGDARSFFWSFENVWRILKPGGHLFATVPSRYSAWLWGDPSHRRMICAESLLFLSQEAIAKNRAMGTAMSDFSALWTRDFKVLSAQDNQQTFIFCLQAIK
jgi:SAM-dependent methyltransferase